MRIPPRFVTIAVLLTGLLAAQSEPAPDGEVRRAVQRLLDADAFDQAALRQVLEAGHASVPLLLERIEQLGGQQHEPKPLATAHRRALRALRLLGPEAAEAAMPTLLEALSPNLERPDVELLHTLRVLAPGSHGDDAMFERLRATRMPAPKPSVDMAAFRRWVDKMTLWYDVYQQQRWGPCDDLDVDDWIDKLEHEDPLWRRLAAERLGRAGHAARDAIPALVVAATVQHPRVTQCTGKGSLTADFHELIHAEARRAIARIDPTHLEARHGLTLLLDADDPTERFEALLAMTRRTDDAGFDVVPAVLRATEDPDARVAAEAVTTLARLGDAREAVRERLQHLATSDDEGLKRRAAAALRTLQKQ